MKRLLRPIWAVLASVAIALAAVGLHELASATAQDGVLDAMGLGSELLVALLLGVLLVLGARYLLILGLATWDRLSRRPPYKQAGQLPFVSVIVPAFNEAPMIRNVLEALLALDYPRCEVIVVDDGSSDQTLLRALPYQRLRADIEFRVLAKANGGKSDALNHGIAHARGEIVVCIDADSILHRDALKHLVAHFDDPLVAAVAGNVRVVNRRTIWSSLQALEYVIGFGLTKRAQSLARAVTIVPGPLGAFRKSAISAVGGYDGSTFAEDFDLTIKLLGAGWHVLYEPRAVVFTEAPERTVELLRQRYRWTRGSLQVLLKRKHRFFAPLASPLQFCALWYMAFDALGLPVLHVAAQLLFVCGGMWLGVSELVVYWWLQLLLLDCAIATFCVAVEEDSPFLAALSPFFRVFYLIVLDVARLFAVADEFARVGMNWDKVNRLGRLAPAT